MSSRNIDLGETPAAKMLAAALRRASEERGQSLRQLAKELNYKQAVVLSHMSLGRVPIPIDRAEQIADVLGIDKRSFLKAVIDQRHPDVDWSLLAGASEEQPRSDPLGEELQVILGKPLAELSVGQRRIMREVANEGDAARRWLSVHELPVIDLIRQWRPAVSEEGLSATDRVAIKSLLLEQLGSPNRPSV